MKRIDPPSADELREMYAKLSLEEMSSHFHVSVTAISNWLGKAGIEKRPKGGIPGRFKVAEVATDDLKRDVEKQIREDGRPNYKELERKHDMTSQAIRQRLKVADVALPPIAHKLSSLEKKEIARLYQQGHLEQALAHQYDVALATISRVLGSSGVTTRSKSEQMRTRHANTKKKLADAERVLASSLPDGWLEWDGEQIIMGMMLLSEGYMSNEQLGERLDSRKVHCRYSSSWQRALAGLKDGGVKTVLNKVSDVRKKVDKPLRTRKSAA